MVISAEQQQVNDDDDTTYAAHAAACPAATTTTAPDHPDDDIYDTRLPLERIPLSALRSRTRDLLAAHLNRRKILPAAESSLWRDWRGLFDLSAVAKSHYAAIEAAANPTEALLRRWLADCPRTATVARLEQCLLDIDRLDCLDDSRENFDCDAKQFMRLQRKAKHIASEPPPPTFTTTHPHNSTEPLPPPPTVADAILDGDTADGAPQQLYDALVIYADDDADDAAFVRLMLDEMTQKRDLRICHSGDILAGAQFEHSVHRQLLVERCHRLIVVLSPAFVLSEGNKYIANLAQSQGIAHNMRKLIPVVHKECRVPPLFQHMVMLNYGRHQTNRLYDFWAKLYRSVERTPRERQLSAVTADAAQRSEVPVITVSMAPGVDAMQPPHKARLRSPAAAADDEAGDSSSLGSDDLPTTTTAAAEPLRHRGQPIYPPALNRRSSQSMMCLSEPMATNGDSGSERSQGGGSMRGSRPNLQAMFKRVKGMFSKGAAGKQAPRPLHAQATLAGSESEIGRATKKKKGKRLLLKA